MIKIIKYIKEKKSTGPDSFLRNAFAPSQQFVMHQFDFDVFQRILYKLT